MSFTFHLLSDLHIEFSQYTLTQPTSHCDALILAGDIGNPWSLEYKEFLHHASSQYQYVFLIKGNHECYKHSLEDVTQQMKKVCNGTNNIIFLDNATFDIENTDIRIVGSTLWSEIEDDQRSDVQCYIADYRHIQGWSIEQNNFHHEISLSFLKKEMLQANIDGKRLVVVTHHAPTLTKTGRPEHDGSPISSAFASDLEKTLIQPPVVAWAFGHTHHSTTLDVNGVKLVSNQRGYQISGRMPERTGFNPGFTFNV